MPDGPVMLADGSLYHPPAARPYEPRRYVNGALLLASEDVSSGGSGDDTGDASGEVVSVSADDLRMLIEDAVAAGSASNVDRLSDEMGDGFAALGSSLSSSSATSGVVVLDDAQYLQLRSDFAAAMTSYVVVLGVLSLILGAVVALGFTSHWKSRG